MYGNQHEESGIKGVVKRDRPPLIKTMQRGLCLRCPVCGQSSIVQSPFNVKRHCSACLALFKREDGFFVGAIAINVVTTEFVIIIVYAACLMAFGYFQSLITLLLLLAVIFPIAFYHHSWSLWLSLDHFVETLPIEGKSEGER